MEWVEEEEDWGTPTQHLLAGAVAGVAEHCGMFPLDTIKTHLQAYTPASQSKAQNVTSIARLIFDTRGVRGFFRGLSSIAVGAAPAHAVYFASYEASKTFFGGRSDGHHPVAVGCAGVVATVCSDTVLTPMDAIKQKMQINTTYKGIGDCLKTVWAKERLFGFYAGYTTTLTMNIPYGLVFFSSYDSLKKLIAPANIKDHKTHHHLLAGAGAGVCSAFITNPMDVAKTRLQTQGEIGVKYDGMLDALRKLWKAEGMNGFYKGVVPRMAFHSLSAAICWAVYEQTKKILL